jgi:hypothetical protein
VVGWLADFQDPHQEWRRLFSELFGTFLLVLVAAGGGMMGHAFPGVITRTDHKYQGLRRPPSDKTHRGPWTPAPRPANRSADQCGFAKKDTLSETCDLATCPG